MKDDQEPADKYDIRSQLSNKDYKHKYEDHLELFHNLANEGLFAVTQIINILVNKDLTPSARSQAIQHWSCILLEKAVRILIFPDTLPDGLTWNDLVPIWNEHSDYGNHDYLVGIRSCQNSDEWLRRDFIKDAWNIEFAKAGEKCEIAHIVTDSAHKAAIMLSVAFFAGLADYLDRADKEPEQQHVFLNDFVRNWANPSILQHCVHAKAKLPTELLKVKEQLGLKTTLPTTVNIGNWQEGAQEIAKTLDISESTQNTSKQECNPQTESWITLSDAERMTGINRGTISRAADNGHILTNGKQQRKRRIHVGSLHQWTKARASEIDEAETNEQVERLFKRQG